MHVLVVGVVVIDRDPLKPGPEIAFHPRHQVLDVLPEIDAVRVLGRNDQRPHYFVAPFPFSDYGRHVEVIPSGIETEASANLALRPIAREIARVPDPRTFAPVTAKRGLHHASPSIKPHACPHPMHCPSASVDAALRLPADGLRRPGAPHSAHPPRDYALWPARLPRLERAEPKPRLIAIAV